MALPAHLQQYDSLLDLLVDALVLRAEARASQTPQTTTPRVSGAALSSPGEHVDGSRHAENSITRQ